MRILALDLETSPNLAHVWGLWDQRVGLSQLLASTEVICFGARWVDEPDVIFKSVHHDGKDEMLLTAHISDEAERPLLVTGYIIGTAVTSFEDSADDGHGYVFETPVNQPVHVSRGLSVLTAEWASGVEYVIDHGDEDG